MPKSLKTATFLMAAIATPLALASPAMAAASSRPAGGGEIGQVIIATTGAMIATAGLLAIVYGHRTGRIGAIKKLVAYSERVSGMPSWSSIPLATLGGTLLIAV